MKISKRDVKRQLFEATRATGSATATPLVTPSPSRLRPTAAPATAAATLREACEWLDSGSADGVRTAVGLLAQVPTPEAREVRSTLMGCVDRIGLPRPEQPAFYAHLADARDRLGAAAVAADAATSAPFGDDGPGEMSAVAAEMFVTPQRRRDLT